MKNFLFLSLLTLTVAHGAEAKTQIRVIKDWVKTTGEEKTCADEYLKRRKQLGIKLGLSPVIIGGSAAIGTFGGALVGSGLYAMSGSSSAGFADLVALVAGGVIGGFTATSTSTVSETIALVNFFKNQNLLKLVYETRNGQSGEALEKFYEKFKESYPESTMDMMSFSEKVSALDKSGALCNGSLVKPERYKKGKKLKQSLATMKEVFHYLSSPL